MVEKYSIVKLVKNKYNQEKITEQDPTPRVLIIRAYEDTKQYLVRYPNGYVHRVNEDWLTIKSTFTPTHLEYPRIAKTMLAVEMEYRRNKIYATVLHNLQPQLAIDLTQRIEAKHRAIQERNQAPAFTMPTVPAVPEPVAEDTNSSDTTVMLLTSIDKSLKTLIQLWGGQQQ